MSDVSKRAPKAHLVVKKEKKRDKEAPSPNEGAEVNKRHKEDFERLLDDAVLGVKLTSRR